MGFGTGLNAILTLCEIQRFIDSSGLQLSVEYHTIEKYPLSSAEYEKIDYAKPLSDIYGNNLAIGDLFDMMHRCEWNKSIEITPYFSLTKIEGDLITIANETLADDMYDVVYFDAFSPASQPELWSEEVFRALCQTMCHGAVLTTYSSKGSVKQNMRAAGFKLQRLPGPGHKRHILRGQKSR